MMSIFDFMPYMIGGPLILSLALATYIYNRKEPAGIFFSAFFFLWGVVFSLFPFLFFAENSESAFFLFRIMTSMLALMPFFYLMGIIDMVKVKYPARKLHVTLFFILSLGIFLSQFIFPDTIGVELEDGIYHGTFSLHYANVALLSSLFYIIIPSLYLLGSTGKLEPGLRIRARGTIAAYISVDVFYITEVYLATYQNYDYVHILNAFIVMGAYAIYYFLIMRRVYYGSPV